MKSAGIVHKTEMMMRETYSILRSHNPGEEESAILRRLLLIRYPDWSGQRIDAFLKEIPNVDILINMVMYRESGLWRNAKETGTSGERGLRSASGLQSREEEVGRVLKSYPHLGIAVIRLSQGELRRGDVVHVKGPHGADIVQHIGVMEADDRTLEIAGTGDTIGLRIEGDIRENDAVYKVTANRKAA